MKEIEKILFATDFSENSVPALDYAKSLAIQFKSKLLLLHVVIDIEDTRFHFAVGALSADKLEKLIEDNTKEMMEKYIDEHVGDFKNFEKIICHGKPFVEILKKCTEHSADLIVVGSHGRTGVNHVIFGSTSERVVRKSKIPVLVVPSEL